MRNNPLRYTDPTGEKVVNAKLTQEQEQEFISDWKAKTGFKDIQFKDGQLVVNVDAGRDGGSDKAAEELLTAVNSADTYNLVAVDGTDETAEVRFADTQLTAARGDGTRTYRVRIDFGDFKALQGDKEAIESFSVGLNALHEFRHTVEGLDYTGDKERRGDADPGPIERTVINPIREQLGLPLRQNYNPEPITRGKFGQKDTGYARITFKAKDGTSKIVRWKTSVTDSVRRQ